MINDYLKVQNFCPTEDTNRIKRQVTEQKVFSILTTNRGLTYSVYEELQILKYVTDSLTEKWTKDLNRGFTKEEI